MHELRSAITIAESIKLGLSWLFHYRECKDGSALASAQTQLSPAAVWRIWLLSFLCAWRVVAQKQTTLRDLGISG